MANALYDLGKKAFLDGDIDLLVDNIKVSLVDGGAYTPNTATDQFYDDMASTIADSANLGTKTTTAGTFDSADFTYTAVSGAQSEYLVMWKDTGTASTSPLIAIYDTATGLPVTPNSGDIDVAVNASGWFSL